MSEPMVALVHGADGDDYARYRIFLVPASKYISDKYLQSINDKLSKAGHYGWLEKLPITVVQTLQEVEDIILEEDS